MLESPFCVTFLQTLEVFSSVVVTSVVVVSDVCSVCIGLATSKCSSPMTLMRQAPILRRSKDSMTLGGSMLGDVILQNLVH